MAVRGTVATPLAATTASVLKEVDWSQMAKLVRVRGHLDVAGVHKHRQVLPGVVDS